VDQFAVSADGSIFVAGEFLHIAGENRPYLAAFNRYPAATLDLPARAHPTSITFNGDPSYSYVIQSSGNLSDWSPVVTNFGHFSFNDSVTNSTKFYRALRQ
jgi:hypothetical protein